MANESMLIQVSAFSGLLGALITQVLTGIFAYLADKRKSNIEIRTTFRNRQLEIAENFYFVTGEKMAIVKQNIDHWNNYHYPRSEKSLDFLNQELKKLNAYMEKLDEQNWKFNLIGLYFNISLDNEKVIASNLRSKALFLKILDLSDEIKHALEESKGDLYDLHRRAVGELCEHYQSIVVKMANDMDAVKKGVLLMSTGK